MSNDVTNLRDTIIAKSDQLNADDIIGTGITITVTAVKRGDSAEQPVVIHYQGDNGRPYKPCKTMRRVLIDSSAKTVTDKLELPTSELIFEGRCD